MHSANCTLEKDWNCFAVERTAESAIAPDGIIGAPSICVLDTCAKLKPGALKPESAAAAAAAVTGMWFQSKSQNSLMSAPPLLRGDSECFVLLLPTVT